MTLVKWMAVTALGGAMVIGPSLSAPPAQAEGYTLTLAEIPNCISPGVGCNPYVTATGAGELDLTPLSLVTSGVTSPTMIPNGGAIITGPTGADQVNFFTGPITGPTSFGSGVAIAPEQGSGDTIGIGRGITSNGTSEFFFFDPAVGFGISGVSDFNSTSLFESNVGTTFSSLGVTPGTYVWSWGGRGHLHPDHRRSRCCSST
jgi:hypothetical protein